MAPPRADAPSVDKPERPARLRRVVGLDGLFTAVFALFGWGVGIQRLSDNSFFWHLRTGELILDQGIPHHDPFSFTAQGTPWVAQSWLAELAYGVTNRVAGPMGIRLMMGLVGAAIAAVTFRLVLRLCRDRVRASMLGIVALACLYMLWSERPLLFGILLFLAVIWVVEVPDSWIGRRPLVALPVLFWLWANVHGSFALGFAYLALHLLGRWVDGHRPWEGERERRLTIGAALAFAVTFVNPYGASLVTFPVDLLRRGDILSHVVEWRSPDFHQLRGLTYVLFLLVFAVILARAPRRVTRRDLIVAIPFLVLGFWALRNVAIAPLVCLPMAARAIAVDTPRPDDPRPRIAWTVAGAIALVAVVLGAGAAQERDFAFESYPVAGMRAIEDQGLLGSRLLADDADGGYIILEHWPEQKVFFDDRFDMYPRPLIEDFFTVSDADSGWERVLRRYDVEVVMWPKDHPLSELLKRSEEWTVTHRDRSHYLFVRTDLS